MSGNDLKQTPRFTLERRIEQRWYRGGWFSLDAVKLKPTPVGQDSAPTWNGPGIGIRLVRGPQ